MTKILYIDMDGVLVDFESAFPIIEQYIGDVGLALYEGRMDEIPNLFSYMQPMPGALDAFDRLCISGKYDIYILSTAPWNNPSAWTEKLIWVKDHLGPAVEKKLILSHQKHLNVGDYLIDDRTKNGADKFTGEHIHFGTEKFPDWETVLTYLKV